MGWPGRIDKAPAKPLNIQAADLSSAFAFKDELQHLQKALRESPAPPEISLSNFRLWLESLLAERHMSWDNDPEGRIRILNYFDLHGGLFEEIFFLGLNERLFPRTGQAGRWWPNEFTQAASKMLGRPLWNDDDDNYRQDELILSGGLGQAKKECGFFIIRAMNLEEKLCPPLFCLFCASYGLTAMAAPF